jgi:hypothetical protein
LGELEAQPAWLMRLGFTVGYGDRIDLLCNVPQTVHSHRNFFRNRATHYHGQLVIGNHTVETEVCGPNHGRCPICNQDLCVQLILWVVGIEVDVPPRK